MNPDGEVVGRDDAAAQTRAAIQTIEGALRALGSGLHDVVRTRIFTTRIEDWEEIGKVHGEFFASVRPVSTMIGVSRLVDPALLVEVEAEAVASRPAVLRRPSQLLRRKRVHGRHAP